MITNSAELSEETEEDLTQYTNIFQSSNKLFFFVQFYGIETTVKLELLKISLKLST